MTSRFLSVAVVGGGRYQREELERQKAEQQERVRQQVSNRNRSAPAHRVLRQHG